VCQPSRFAIGISNLIFTVFDAVNYLCPFLGSGQALVSRRLLQHLDGSIVPFGSQQNRVDLVAKNGERDRSGDSLGLRITTSSFKVRLRWNWIVSWKARVLRLLNVIGHNGLH
jgi:hypothetical protein